LGIISKLLRRSETPSKKTWKRYFEARIAVMVEWYGVPREEILALVAEKMELGFTGDAVFDEVKRNLESSHTRILERR